MDKETENLFRVGPKEYGERYQDHLLEQYKMYVASAEQNSSLRHSANNFFLTLNTALVSLFGILASSYTGLSKLWLQVMPLAGILICWKWYALIMSYKQLNTGKFVVIHKLEEKLPAALYDYEWDVLKKGDGTKYTPFTHIENQIPKIFILLYIALALISILV